MMFMSDLCRAIDLPVDVDFMAVSSYGSATRTSGVVRIVKDLDADLAGRHVLVVEDIIDSGLTLNYLRATSGPVRPERRGVRPAGQGRASSAPSSTCATSASHPAEFVVGYGLDVDERRATSGRSTPTPADLRRPAGGG
jgi:hypoxanthine-guanine phosphoribosyltransferase